MTLRTRFALWVAGLLLAVMAVFGVLVYISMARGLISAVDSALLVTAAQAVATANSENGRIEISDGGAGDAGIASLEEPGVVVRYFDALGSLIDAVGPATLPPLQPADLRSVRMQRSGFATVAPQGEGNTYRLYTTPIVEDGQLVGILQVGQSLEDVQATLERLRTILLVSAPILAAIAGLGGYALAARALAPIDTITRTAERISSEDLSARLDLPATRDEVGRLSTTLDRMLGRLEDAFRRERRFVADASHELRTPLAAMQAILSVMQERPRTVPEYEQTLVDLSEETERLHTLVEDLLLLARSDQRQGLTRQRVELSPLLENVVEALRPLADVKGLHLTCAVEPDLTLVGDEDALIRVFVNLLDNALKYTELGSVDLSAWNMGSELQVVISDTGAGIAPEHLPHIFERFYRVDASRSSGGVGLGLGLVQDIVHAHGGSIEAQSEVGVGSEFTVVLPAR